jgi:hypothetical protein
MYARQWHCQATEHTSNLCLPLLCVHACVSICNAGAPPITPQMPQRVALCVVRHRNRSGLASALATAACAAGVALVMSKLNDVTEEAAFAKEVEPAFDAVMDVFRLFIGELINSAASPFAPARCLHACISDSMLLFFMFTCITPTTVLS